LGKLLGNEGPMREAEIILTNYQDEACESLPGLRPNFLPHRSSNSRNVKAS
jgi:hypothetical protein